MERPADRRIYIFGALVGAAGFFLARDGFFWLLRELGYVDGTPTSVVISVLFLGCMFVMCAGYGIGLTVFAAKKIWGARSVS